MGEGFLMLCSKSGYEPSKGTGYNRQRCYKVQGGKGEAPSGDKFDKRQGSDPKRNAGQNKPIGDIGEKKPIEEAIGHIADYSSRNTPSHETAIFIGIFLQE
jgi:hypothetical protein